jgi:hypothetical protein
MAATPGLGGGAAEVSKAGSGVKVGVRVEAEVKVAPAAAGLPEAMGAVCMAESPWKMGERGLR